MNIRRAIRKDISTIIHLLANDPLGQNRETATPPLPDAYYHAFDAIDRDPNQELMVIENDDRDVIGTFQLTFIHYLNYTGGLRAQVESVRLRDDYRGKGVGQWVFEWIIERARKRNVRILQLTSDKKRPEAIRFYERLGFVASHEGLKLHFTNSLS